MIIPSPLKRACEKKFFAMSRTGKGRTCQTRKQKVLIIILNQGRKISHLIEILGIITHAIFLTEIFNEVIQKLTHSKNPTVTRNKEFTNNHSNYVKSNELKEPVKCWECQGPHYASVCPNRKKTITTFILCKKKYW